MPGLREGWSWDSAAELALREMENLLERGGGDDFTEQWLLRKHHMQTHTHVHTQGRTNTHTNTHTYTCAHVNTHKHTHMYTHMRAQTLQPV